MGVIALRARLGEGAWADVIGIRHSNEMVKRCVREKIMFVCVRVWKVVVIGGRMCLCFKGVNQVYLSRTRNLETQTLDIGLLVEHQEQSKGSRKDKD